MGTLKIKGGPDPLDTPLDPPLAGTQNGRETRSWNALSGLLKNKMDSKKDHLKPKA